MQPQSVRLINLLDHSQKFSVSHGLHSPALLLVGDAHIHLDPIGVKPHQLPNLSQPRNHPRRVFLFPGHLHGPQKPRQDAISINRQAGSIYTLAGLYGARNGYIR